jgi:hypothetical protein
MRYDGIANVIGSSVQLSSPNSLLLEGETAIATTCIGIWDTGASASAITELTAKKLKLAPTGGKNVSGLGGTIFKNTYLIDIVLPNGITIYDLSVTELDNPKDHSGNIVDNFGMLIGMDIINRGDFVVTNFQGKTVMSFRMPSTAKVDYVEEWNRRMAVQQKNKKR